MVKWPFRRNSEATADQPEYQVPSEIQDYYQAERRERTGMAWLMAAGTLVVTVLLAVGLFFGGRWVYRKVAGNNPQPAGNSNVEQATTDNAANAPQTSSTNTNQPSTPPAATPPPSTPSASNPAPGPSPASPAPATSPSVATNQQSNLPSTGPADVVAAVALATIVGTAGHYLVTNRRTSRSN